MAEYEQQRAAREATAAGTDRGSPSQGRPATPLSTRLARAAGGEVVDRPRAVDPSTLRRAELARTGDWPPAQGHLPSPPRRRPDDVERDAARHARGTGSGLGARRTGLVAGLVLAVLVALGLAAVLLLG